MSNVCQVHILGEMPYLEAWDLQNELAEEIRSGNRLPTLLFLEHPHTYTFGRSGESKNLLWDETRLAEKGIEVHWVDRGGDITYHGPGQLVGYPLLPLGRAQSQNAQNSNQLPRADYIGYLRKLEATLISTLKAFGLQGEQIPGMTGVWSHTTSTPTSSGQGPSPGLHPTKIASIGVKVDSHGISRHGFALNVDPDMSFWDGIIGCGLEGFSETSLGKLLSPTPLLPAVINEAITAFGEHFDYQMQVKPLKGSRS
jgi:lipoyl(octanoyl) transferase